MHNPARDRRSRPKCSSLKSSRGDACAKALRVVADDRHPRRIRMTKSGSILRFREKRPSNAGIAPAIPAIWRRNEQRAASTVPRALLDNP